MVTKALLQQAIDALETGLDCAINKAEDTHDSYKGYYPERHVQVDRDVADIESAIEALKAELEKPGPEPVAFLCHGHPYLWPSQDDFCGNPEDHVQLFTKEQL